MGREDKRPHSRQKLALAALVTAELQSSRRLSLGLVTSVTLHGLGHGGLALAAGLLGRSLLPGAATSAHWGAQEVLIFGLVATAVKATAGTFSGFFEATLSVRVANRLRQKAGQALLAGGLHDGASRGLATIAVRVREVELATKQGVVNGIRAFAQLVPLLATLIVLSAPTALIALTCVIPFALLLAWVRRRWRSQSEHSQRLAEDLVQGVDDLVKNLDLFRSYAAGARVEQAIQRAGERAERAQARVDAGQSALSGANEVLAAAVLLAAFWVAGRLGLNLASGATLASVIVVFMAYRPLRDLGDARGWIARGQVALSALERLPNASRSEATQPAAPAQQLARLVLNQAGARGRGPASSFAVEPGELVVVTGSSGSGKTSLLLALLGLLDSRGSIVYAGRELARAPVGPPHRPFAWVPQDAPLVSGTLRENVGLLAESEAAVAQAIETLGLEPLDRLLSDTAIGPAGRAVSGGERRLINLARAFASGLPVLLLDEPSEGLDEAAERRVLDAIGRLRGQRSVIVVSHRANLAALAERVVPLGSQELLAASAAE